MFGFGGDRTDKGDEPQLFKPTQDNCFKWEKKKISNDKVAFAMFYVNERNKNKWWTQTSAPDNPLVEVFLPLTVMLSGALGGLANRGCTPYKM